MRDKFIKTLYELTGANSNIYALISDNGAIVFDQYINKFPDNLINIGIAEANMIGIAAGMASCGKIPFAYTIVPFLTMRAFEQIRIDVCYQKMNVKLVGIGCGFVYSNLGATHHSFEDIALMRTLPGMTIFSPCDSMEVDYVTREAAKINGPVYIRIATGSTPDIYKEQYDFKYGKGVILREGTDATIISTGLLIYEVLRAADNLQKRGISVRVINIHTIKPLDPEIILTAASETKNILVVEDHSIFGGLGEAVCSIIAKNINVNPAVKCLGMEDTFGNEYGSFDDLKKAYKLDSESVECELVKLLKMTK